MACPHVAGVVALYLQANPTMKPADIAKALLSAATKDAITDAGTDSPNKLLYAKVAPAPTLPPATRRRAERRRKNSSRRRSRRRRKSSRRRRRSSRRRKR